MSEKSNDSSIISKGLLQQSQLESLKSLSLLLVREINFLEEKQAILGKQIESENPINLLQESQRLEINLIRCALIRSMGRQNKAARLLGLKITTLSEKIRRYNIDLTACV
ncbi:MAG: helix-turn-helix domain-containing protein [Pyrinomonadaceae bacterium]